MNNFINRSYFNKNTGELLLHYEMQGCINVQSITEDIVIYPQLEAFTEDTLIVIETQQEDSETRDKQKTATSTIINPETLEIIYDFTPLPELPQEQTPEERIVELEGLLEDATSLLIESGVL